MAERMSGRLWDLARVRSHREDAKHSWDKHQRTNINEQSAGKDSGTLP
jgi:hypothetical protein